MLTKLDHIIIAQPDFAQEAKWAALLGRPPVWQGTHPGEGTANRLFRMPEFYLELMAPEGEGGHAQRVRQFLTQKGEGVMGLSFACDNADALAETWRKAGFSPSPPQSGEGRDNQTGALRKWRLVFLPPEQTRNLFVFAIEHQSPADTLPLLPPEKTGEAIGLDHVVLASPEPEASGAFFEKIGLRLALVRPAPQGEGELRFLRLAGVSVEIMGPVKAEQDGFWGLAWRVDNLPAAHARLTEAGFNLSAMRVGRKEGSSVFTVRDAPANIPTLIICHQPLPA